MQYIGWKKRNISPGRGLANVAVPARSTGCGAGLSRGRHADRALRPGLAGETDATMEIAEFGVVLLLADIKPFKGFLMGPIAPEMADARVNPPAKGRESPDS